MIGVSRIETFMRDCHVLDFFSPSISVDQNALMCRYSYIAMRNPLYSNALITRSGILNSL